MDNKRSDKLSSLIHQSLGHILLEMTGALGMRPVSVTRVDLKPDITWADVHLSFLDEQAEKEDFPKLVKNLYDIQGELNRKLTLKKLPRLRLFIDEGIKYADKIDEIISNLNDTNSDE
jgi:ribosome-binding factor A